MNSLRVMSAVTALALLGMALPALAASRVYELHYAIPDEVATAVRAQHGSQVQAEVVRQRLLVIGPEQRLQAIDELVRDLDAAPLPLRLTLSLQPPPADRGGRSYGSGAAAIELSSVEGALTTIEHSRFGQHASSAGWVVEVYETPVAINAVTLQIRRRSDELLSVVVSYTDYRNGERRVLGNTLAAALGQWVSLLPTSVQPAIAGATTYSTGSGADQLWLRIDHLQ